MATKTVFSLVIHEGLLGARFHSFGFVVHRAHPRSKELEHEAVRNGFGCGHGFDYEKRVCGNVVG